MFIEEDLLPISALQHLIFCERQWGLIHLEGVWAENVLTAEGRILHDKTHEPGAETRKTVLTAYQKRKQDEVMHPFLKEKLQIGLLPHIQALLMARYIRGELDTYPPFIWK